MTRNPNDSDGLAVSSRGLRSGCHGAAHCVVRFNASDQLLSCAGDGDDVVNWEGLNSLPAQKTINATNEKAVNAGNDRSKIRKTEQYSTDGVTL